MWRNSNTSILPEVYADNIVQKDDEISTTKPSSLENKPTTNKIGPRNKKKGQYHLGYYCVIPNKREHQLCTINDLGYKTLNSVLNKNTSSRGQSNIVLNRKITEQLTENLRIIQ